MILTPGSYWLCLSEACSVTAFGLVELHEGVQHSRCPKCSGLAKRADRQTWLLCRIAYEQVIARSPNDLVPTA